mgnify:CR=1 FL=1
MLIQALLSPNTPCFDPLKYIKPGDTLKSKSTLGLAGIHFKSLNFHMAISHIGSECGTSLKE